MNQAAAQRAVTTSALIVIAVYAYRRLTEPASGPATLKKLAGQGAPAPLGAFATGWGFTFLVIAVMAEISPGLGGSFAILVATGDVLANTPAIAGDVGKRVAVNQPSSSSLKSTGGTAIIAGAQNPNKAAGGVQIATGNVTAGIGQALDPLQGIVR